MADCNLLKRSYAVLLDGARAVSGATFKDDGYVHKYEENLIQGLPLDAITTDLESGAGKELDGKLRAAHSSSALVVNHFGPWRLAPDSLRINGVSGFCSIRFEATCPTGLRGTPPHLDMLACGPNPIAIESKCTEWMEGKPARFSASYDRLSATHGHSPWYGQIELLRRRPGRYRHLDAAQLVKACAWVAYAIRYATNAIDLSVLGAAKSLRLARMPDAS
jgi:hypothetical protein